MSDGLLEGGYGVVYPCKGFFAMSPFVTISRIEMEVRKRQVAKVREAGDVVG